MIIDELKARARLLHRAVEAGDGTALARVRDLPERAAEARDLGATLKRRHCLAVIARELGFEAWAPLKAVLEGERIEDFGTLLHRPACGGHSNIWCADYEEARAIRADHGGYLLPWRRQFLVVDDHYIEALGLDPEDPNWARMGRDWVTPREPGARTGLYETLIQIASPRS